MIGMVSNFLVTRDRLLNELIAAGLLSKNLMQLSQRLSADEMPGVEAESSESDIEYPLTPPLSDVADSRPLSPFNTTILDLNVDTLEYPTVHSTLMRRISGVKRRR